MNKKLKIVVTLFLILTMLFGVMSTTVLAAGGTTGDSGDGNASSVIDSLDTGWCEITYDSEGITVTLNPDVKSLLDINEEEIREVLGILIDAVKAIVVEDLKNDILHGGNNEEESSEPEVQTYSLRKAAVTTKESELPSNFEGMFTTALNAFVAGKYGDSTYQEYITFMKDILADKTMDDPGDKTNTTVEDFIGEICELVKLAVAGGVPVDSLPEATDALKDTIIKEFNNKINEYIDDAAEALLPTYAQNYLDDVVNEGNSEYTAKLSESMRAIIDKTVAGYIKEEVNEYIDNGFKVLPDSTDPVDPIVGTHTDNQVKIKVKEWIANYGDGNLSKNPDTVNTLIDGKIQSYIDEFVTHYFAGTKPDDNPIYDHVAGLADTIKSEKIDEYKTAFLNCQSLNADIESLMYDYIKDAVYDLFWVNRGNSINNNKPFDADSVWAQIEEALVTEVLKANMETAVKTAIEKAVDEAIPMAVDEAIGKVVDEAIAKVVDEAIAKVVDEAIAKVVDEAIAKVVDEAIGKVVDEAIGKVVDEAIGKVVDEAIGEVVDEAIGKVVDEAIDEVVREAIAEVVKEAIDTAIDAEAENIKNAEINKKVDEAIQDLIADGMSQGDAEAKRQEILDEIMADDAIMAEIDATVAAKKENVKDAIYGGAGYTLEFNGETQTIQYDAIIADICDDNGDGFDIEIDGANQNFKKSDIIAKINGDEGYTFTYGGEDHKFKYSDIIAKINGDEGYTFTYGGEDYSFKRSDIIAKINGDEGYTFTYGGEDYSFKRSDIIAKINSDEGYTFTYGGEDYSFKRSDIIAKINSDEGYTFTYGGEDYSFKRSDIIAKINSDEGYTFTYGGEDYSFKRSEIIAKINSDEGYTFTYGDEDYSFKRSEIIAKINSDEGYTFTYGGEDYTFKRSDIIAKINSEEGYTFSYGGEDYTFKRSEIIAKINSEEGYTFTYGDEDYTFKRSEIIAKINSEEGYTFSYGGEDYSFKRSEILNAIYEDKDGYSFTLNGNTVTLKYAEIYDAVKNENAPGYTVTFGDKTVTITYGDLYNAAYDEYRETSNEDIKKKLTDSDINKFKSEIVNEIKKLGAQKRNDIWNKELSEDDRKKIIQSVEKSNQFESIVKNEVQNKWLTGEKAAENRQSAVKEIVSNSSYQTVFDSFLSTMIGEAINDKDNLAIIKSVVAELWKDQNAVLVEFYAMIRNLAATDAKKFADIKNAVVEKAKTIEIDDSIISEAFVNFFGMTRQDVEQRLRNAVIPAFLVKYGALLAELMESPDIELDYEELIKYIATVSINDIVLYKDGTVDIEAIRELLKTVPTPNEIKDMTDEQMQLSYKVSVTTTLQTSTDITLTARLGGGYDKVRRFATLFCEYVDISLGEGNILNLRLKVPARFAKFLLKAINYDEIPEKLEGQITKEQLEKLKKKIFDAIDESPNDVYALLKDVTLDELLTLFDYVDFDKVLDSEYLSKFEKLDGLTEEQIKEKIKGYSEEYDKLVRLIKRIYENRVPDKLKDATLVSLYDGSGKFSVAGSQTVNVEKVLNKLTEKYGALLASFISVSTVSAGIDAEVQFEQINKVTYMLGGKVLKTGFLPAGADLAFFAGVTEYNGEKIKGWTGDDGITYKTMPDKDIVLEPEYDIPAITPPQVEISGTPEEPKTYDGEEVVLTATIKGGIPENVDVSYQWYKRVYFSVMRMRSTPSYEDIKLDNQTDESLVLKDVKDSGVYFCSITLTDLNGNSVTVNTEESIVTINKATPSEIDTPDAVVGLEYTGSAQELVTPGANVGGTWVYKVEGDDEFSAVIPKRTAAGTYTVFYKIHGGDNYEDASEGSVTVVIAESDDFAVTPPTAINPVYNGTAQALIQPGYLQTLHPDRIALEYKLEGEAEYSSDIPTATEAGDYKLWYKYTITDPNYSSDGGEDYVWVSILKAPQTFTETPAAVPSLIFNGNAQVLITAGAASNGTMMYKLSDAAEYSTELPTAVGAGTYTVMYMAEGGTNYEDIFGEITVVIAKAANPGYVTLPTAVPNLIYSGSAQALVTAGTLADGVGTIVYRLSTETEYSINIPTATLSGAYTVYYKIIGGANYNDSEESQLTASIGKYTIDFTGYTWKPTTFVYNGEAQSVYLVNENGDSLTYGIEYSGNVATNAGTYIAKVSVPDLNNFTTNGAEAITEFEWVITKAPAPDMSGVAFKNQAVKYDGAAHGIYISGTLPEGVTVSYSENSFTEPGVYTVTATFTVSENYESIPAMTATLTILGYRNQHQIIDTDNTLILSVESESGIVETHVLIYKDITASYVNFDFGKFFGDGLAGVLGGAYDIHFAEDGTQQKIIDNFTVKLLIPVNLRNTTNPLKVVHIAENGDLEDMNATVEGEYMVFNTTHFSVYSIVEVVPAVADTSDDKNNAWIWILLLIILLLIIAAIIVFALVRKNIKGTEPAEEVETATEAEPTEAPAPETEAVVEEESAPEEAVQEIATEDTALEAPVEEAPAEATPIAPTITLMGKDSGEAIVNGEVVQVRYRTSFMSRLIQSGDVMQKYYTVIKNALLSYKGVKARTSWNFESFNKGRVQCAKLNVKGSALQVYLALDPDEYSVTKYHFTDVSDKPKLDQVPMMLKVKSDRALKSALELIEAMMTKLGIEKAKEQNADYSMPYETTEELAARGLVKVILPAGIKLDGDECLVKVNVGEMLDNVKAEATVAEDVAAEETVVEEPVVEEAAVEEPVEEAAPVEEAPAAPTITLTGKDSGEAIVNGEVVQVRYRTSFISRLIQSGDVMQSYYTVIKNALLSYKGVKARTSWNFESFNKGRVQCAKLNVKGNAFQLYLALDPKEYNANKYHFTDVSDKPKLDQVPMMLKIKSDRALKYALELIAAMMTKLEIEKAKEQSVDYSMPYETTEELAARGLVKVILPAGVKLDGGENLVKVNVGEMLDNVKAEATVAEDVAVEEQIVEEPVIEKTVVEAPSVEETVVEEAAEEVLHLDAVHADEILSDEEATAKIEVVERVCGAKGQGKLAEINLDTICENFEDGDEVTLEALKAKKLVNKNAGRIKILARGTMIKKLTIYADKFSIQAVKMITLAGGHADQYK